jgi:hypothetical protein
MMFWDFGVGIFFCILCILFLYLDVYIIRTMPSMPEMESLRARQ